MVNQALPLAQAAAPSVSVVITTYNRAAIVAEAIHSVLAQTRPVDEVIVVDDGSTDNTEEAVRAAFAGAAILCRYVRKENGGMATALNRGVDEAIGNVIAFLDDDDLWHADHIERGLSVLSAYPSVGCAAGVRVKNGLGPEKPPLHLLEPYARVENSPSLLIHGRKRLSRPFWTPVVGTSLVRAEFFRQLRFASEAGARLDVHFFWCLSELTDIALDLDPHATGRTFRVSYLGTDKEAPQSLKDEITLRRSNADIQMLKYLLSGRERAETGVFRALLARAVLGKAWHLRSVGRFNEALAYIPTCIGECSFLSLSKEFILALARIKPG